MNKNAKRFLQSLIPAYLALMIVMTLIWLGLVPAGPISLIVLDMALIWVNVASCKWLLDKAIDISGIPRDKAYGYYHSILSRKTRNRRRYWHRWVAERTENFEEFLYWDKLAHNSTLPSALFPLLCIFSVSPGLKWLPNTLLVLIPAFCLILAYQGFCYHSKQK